MTEDQLENFRAYYSGRKEYRKTYTFAWRRLGKAVIAVFNAICRAIVG